MYQEGSLLIRNGKIVQGADSATATNQGQTGANAAAKVCGVSEQLENIAEYMDLLDTVVVRRVSKTFDAVLRQLNFNGKVMLQTLAVLPVGKGPKRCDEDYDGNIFWSVDAQLVAKFLNQGTIAADAACGRSKNIHLQIGPGGATARVCAVSLTQASRTYGQPKSLARGTTMCLFELATLTHGLILREFKQQLQTCTFLLRVQDTWEEKRLPLTGPDEDEETLSSDSDTDEHDNESTMSWGTEEDEAELTPNADGCATQ
ncbi:hypothetical protein BST61_g533 [Cercospora zeina]